MKKKNGWRKWIGRLKNEKWKENQWRKYKQGILEMRYQAKHALLQESQTEYKLQKKESQGLTTEFSQLKEGLSYKGTKKLFNTSKIGQEKYIPWSYNNQNTENTEQGKIIKMYKANWSSNIYCQIH